MKIGTLNLNVNSTGVQTLDIPADAVIHNAFVQGGVVQVHYSYDQDTPKEACELRVVQNGVEYPDDWAYIDMLHNPSNNQVTHVVHHRAHMPSPPIGAHPSHPIATSAGGTSAKPAAAPAAAPASAPAADPADDDESGAGAGAGAPPATKRKPKPNQ